MSGFIKATVLFALVAGLLAGATMLQAGTISYTAIPATGSDVGSGISSSNTYTIAGDPGEGGTATVNGVPFNMMATSGTNPKTLSWTIGGHTYTYSITNCDASAWIGGYTWVGAGMCLVDGQIKTILSDMLYNKGTVSQNGEVYTLTIPASSLTTGYIYDFRVYNRQWWTTPRMVSLYFDEDGAGPLGASTGTINQDDATTVGFATVGQCYYSNYRYQATGQDFVFKATRVSDAGYHFYGFTNQFVDVPEPSTLALLAMGLVGLLCYAWRRKRQLVYLAAVLAVLAWAAPVQAGGGGGPFGASDLGLTPTDLYFDLGGEIGNPSEPLEIYYDPNAGPLRKVLGNIPEATDPGTSFNIIEYLHVFQMPAWTDWHQRILDDGWSWVDTPPTLIASDGQIVNGVINGRELSFDFNPLPPCTMITINKWLTWDGPGFAPPTVTIDQWPTVPEPGTIVLLATGILAGLGYLWRRRRG